jgi:hypothetical protein
VQYDLAAAPGTHNVLCVSLGLALPIEASVIISIAACASRLSSGIFYNCPSAFFGWDYMADLGHAGAPWSGRFRLQGRADGAASDSQVSAALRGCIS